MYPALLPRTPRLPVVDWTDAPADLNWLVRFVERRNLVSARAPSHFNSPFLTVGLRGSCGRSRWPWGLRSAVANLLVSRVGIPLMAWMFVAYICCALYVTASTKGWSPVQRSSTGCECLTVSDLETSMVGRPMPQLVCSAREDRMWQFIHFSASWLTLRRLMSYIYGAPILDVSRSHTTTQHSR